MERFIDLTEGNRKLTPRRFDFGVAGLPPELHYDMNNPPLTIGYYNNKPECWDDGLFVVAKHHLEFRIFAGEGPVTLGIVLDEKLPYGVTGIIKFDRAGVLTQGSIQSVADGIKVVHFQFRVVDQKTR